MAVNTIVIDVADAERGSAVAGQRDRQQPAEQPDRRMVRHPGHHDGLGDDVGRDDEHGHREQQPDPARPRGRGGGGAVQRRSWRCLQATHRVARGNASRRALPIGWPQDSHTPYVPASIRPSGTLTLVEQVLGVLGESELVLALERLGPGVRLVVAGVPDRVVEPSAMSEAALAMSARRPSASASSSARTCSSSAAVQGSSPGRTGSPAASDRGAADMRCLPSW